MAIGPGDNAMLKGTNPAPVIIVGMDGDGNLTEPYSEDNPLPVSVVSGGSSEEPLVAGTAPTPVTVSTSNLAIVSSDADREMLWLQNMGPNTVYIQHTVAAVVANAWPFKINDVLLLSGREAKAAWNGICAAAESAVIRILPGTV